MAFSTAAKQGLALLKQGPVSLVVDPDDTAVDLFVSGGLDTSFIRGVEEARVDIIGVYDLYTSGDSAEFTLTLPEMSLEVLDAVFPEGTDGTDGAKTYRGFGRSAGYSLRSGALPARIRPWAMRDDENPADVQIDFWLIAPNGTATLRQGVTEPYVWEQPFVAFPDLTKADGQLIARLYSQGRAA